MRKKRSTLHECGDLNTIITLHSPQCAAGFLGASSAAALRTETDSNAHPQKQQHQHREVGAVEHQDHPVQYRQQANRLAEGKRVQELSLVRRYEASGDTFSKSPQQKKKEAEHEGGEGGVVVLA